MMNAQITTAASGASADASVSGVLKGQGKKGGLFAVLMQAFQSHLKIGAIAVSGDGKLQGGDPLASLLQGKHGAEISALLAKLGKGDVASDAELLQGLSIEALSALKLALSQDGLMQQPVDGAVDLVAQIKVALDAMASKDDGVASQEVSVKAAAAEDGSSLQVGLVAAGVRVEQSKLTTGGTKQQADGSPEASIGGLAEDLVGGKGKKTVAGLGQQGKQSAADQVVAEKVVSGKIVSERIVSEKIVSEKIVSEKIVSEKIVSEKIVASQVIAEKVPVEKAIAGQAVVEKTTTGQAVVEKPTAGQLVTDKAAVGHAATEKVAVDHTSTEKVTAVQVTAGAVVTTQNTSTKVTIDPTAPKQDSHGNPLYTAVGDPSAKSNVVTVAKSIATDDAPQDDGVSLLASRSFVAPTVHVSGNSDGSAARVAQQALATAQGNQHNGAGDQGSQNKQQSSQSGFESLINASRADMRTTARGAEFAIPLSYKSATTWKPADAMMQIGKAAADGSIRLDLQLEPAHLGKVNVSIQTDASKQVQLYITVDNVAGRVALDQNMGQLRMALAQQGLDLGNLSMNLSSQGQQGHGGEGSPSSKGQRGGFRIESDSVQIESGAVAEAGVNQAGAGRLSVLA